ncbi:hypothetical protein O7632_01930 [Solwaraspora sp. WMMD406]|uniref:hypothetical protein n=1 Tax=Solwaraspora sp. WMMD406 TaxID=3016095 RepID=UPI002416D8DC|nr:hypothetical protein [Solwaraspora sp. WMMD406]MDG4762880.1 hypothetical protein [Solwaraspora sp. WMMD406]
MLGSSQTDGVDEVRDLARRGLLSATIATASGAYRVRLTGATYSIVWPVVYRGLTRKIEMRRGHLTCATSISRLAADCLDRFHNDVDAVVDDVVRRAVSRIENLDGWIASRLVPATVDGHRRRRGAIGALQRPRVPGWLSKQLGGDPWLIDLATQILIWVGVPSSAGYDLWPTQAWVARRWERHGDWSTYGEAQVRADIRVVLDAMSHRPQWYERYVEVPLGRKQAPVVAVPRLDDRDGGRPPAPTDVSIEHEQDRVLTALAHDAVALITARLARGEPARQVVADVLGVVFGTDDAVAPGSYETGDRGYGDRLDRMLRDATELDRLVAAVLDIVSIHSGTSAA